MQDDCTLSNEVTEALDRGICVRCREPALAKCYTEAGVHEYRISGLCKECFDEITKE